MSFQTEKIGVNKDIASYYLDVSGNLNVDGSIYQFGTLFEPGGGGGGGGGDVGWENGSYGLDSQIITAAGDGSISASAGLTWSGSVIEMGNGGNRTIQIADGTSPRIFTIKSNDNTISGEGGQLILEAGAGAGGSDGGLLSLLGGTGAGGQGGDVLIQGGGASGAKGGDIKLVGGGASGGGGAITLEGGTGSSGQGGDVSIYGGEAASVGARSGYIYFGTQDTSAIYMGASSTIPTGTPSGSEYLFIDTSDSYRLKRATVSSGPVDSYTNGANNRILTSTSSSGINGEANLTFNPTASQTDSGLNVAATIRTTSQTVPTSGSGMEMVYTTTGGFIHTYNRTGSAYLNTTITGSSTNIRGMDTSGSIRSGFNFHNGAIVLNEDGADVDIRMEGDTNANMFVLDAGLEKIMVGAAESTFNDAAPAYLNVFGDDVVTSTTSIAINNKFAIEVRNSGSSSDQGTGIRFTAGSGDNYNGTAAIVGNDDGGFGAGELLFAVKNAETQEPSTMPVFHALSGINQRGSWFNSAGTEEIRFNLATGQGDFNGDVVAYSTLVSDRRLKENIKPLGSSLDKVLQLEGVTYDRKSNGQSHVGYIAQDVEQVIPEVIAEKVLPLEARDEETLYKTLRYQELIPYITEAMKEQQKIINDQQKEIDDLKSQMTTILEKLK